MHAAPLPRKASKRASVEVRKRPLQERSRMTMEAILEAAYELFHLQGHQVTSMRISQRAGVAVGSLYQYFPNKDAILQALIDQNVTAGFATLVEQAAGALQAGADAEACVSGLVAATTNLYAQEAKLLQLQRQTLMGNQPSMIDADQIRKQVDSLASALGGLPGMTRTTAVIAAPLLVQTVDSLCRHYVLQAAPPTDQAAFQKTLVNLLHRYLA